MAGGGRVRRVWNTRTNHGRAQERRVCVISTQATLSSQDAMVAAGAATACFWSVVLVQPVAYQALVHAVSVCVLHAATTVSREEHRCRRMRTPPRHRHDWRVTCLHIARRYAAAARESWPRRRSKVASCCGSSVSGLEAPPPSSKVVAFVVLGVHAAGSAGFRLVKLETQGVTAVH